MTGKLKPAQTFTSFETLIALDDTAKNHIALDSNFDVFKFVEQLAGMTGANISFVTLPITKFGTVDGSPLSQYLLHGVTHQL